MRRCVVAGAISSKKLFGPNSVFVFWSRYRPSCHPIFLWPKYKNLKVCNFLALYSLNQLVNNFGLKIINFQTLAFNGLRACKEPKTKGWSEFSNLVNPNFHYNATFSVSNNLPEAISINVWSGYSKKYALPIMSSRISNSRIFQNNKRSFYFWWWQWMCYCQNRK